MKIYSNCIPCADSSDEEYVEERGAAGGDVSDVCSDLEEEEREEEGSHGSRSTPDSCSDDDEGVNHSHLGKRKVPTLRVLDSDDEEDSLGGEGKKASGGDVFAARPPLDLLEGSMPPLRLDSVEDTNSPLSSSPSLSPSPSQPTKTLAQSLVDSGIGPSQLQTTSLTEKSLGAVSEGGRAEKEEEEEKRDEGSMSVVTDADSLEFSFQWGQSLPLAQPVNPDAPPAEDKPVRKPSLLHPDTMDISEEEESQWQATPAKNQLLTQDADTQFLDEDG